MNLTFDDLVVIERLIDYEIKEKIKDYREVESPKLRARLQDSIDEHKEIKDKIVEMRREL